MGVKINSKAERAAILQHLVHALIDANCQDMKILTEVDRLCRRTWEEQSVLWMRWSYHIGKIIGHEKYGEWGSNNCKKATR